MNVSVFASPGAVVNPSRTIRGCHAVVIDALRATSVIITALEHGASSVIPVARVSEAAALARSMDAGEVLLCGERRGVRPPGFDLGNSPLEFTAEKVAGKTIVMTTTNGTRAVAAARGAARLTLGGMINATAAAAAAAGSGLPVTILMAGTRGRFSLDDALAAGSILDALAAKGGEMDDLAQVCLRLYRDNRKDPLKALARCAHFRTLAALGFLEDVKYCMSRDIVRTAPRLDGDRIVGQ